MNQFYVLPDQVTEHEIRLTGQEAKHASKVLRIRQGDPIRATDGEGTVYHAKVISVTGTELRATIEFKDRVSKPEESIVLCLGLIRKRDRLEFAAEKATELGVSEIFLFQADHTEPFKVRTDRLEAAVLQAMKQSLRAHLPSVKLFGSLEELLSKIPRDSAIIEAAQDGGGQEDQNETPGQDRYLVVGPEGGLSVRERELLDERGVRRVKLGEYRLRAETAAIFMSALYGT